MKAVVLTRTEFVHERHEQAFAEQWDPLFDAVREFFNCGDRQRRMEETEIHHDRAPLAGVVRDLEMLPAFNQYSAACSDSSQNVYGKSLGWRCV